MSESQAEQLIEELQKAKVADLLVHTCSLLGSLAFGKLELVTRGQAPDFDPRGNKGRTTGACPREPAVRDLEQARLAIDALKALTPLLPEEQLKDVQAMVANLQLAYADAASG